MKHLELVKKEIQKNPESARSIEKDSIKHIRETSMEKKLELKKKPNSENYQKPAYENSGYHGIPGLSIPNLVFYYKDNYPIKLPIFMNHLLIFPLAFYFQSFRSLGYEIKVFFQEK